MDSSKESKEYFTGTELKSLVPQLSYRPFEQFSTRDYKAKYSSCDSARVENYTTARINEGWNMRTREWTSGFLYNVYLNYKLDKVIQDIKVTMEIECFDANGSLYDSTLFTLSN